jgi:hypothetical protein
MLLVIEMPPKGARTLRRLSYWHLLIIPLHHLKRILSERNNELL